MAAVTINLREDFETFGIDIPNDDIIDKFHSLLEYYGLDASQLVEKYVAYRSNNNIVSPVTTSDIDIFEKESLGKSATKKVIPRAKNFKPNRSSFLSSQVDTLIASDTTDDQLSVLESYGATPDDNRTVLSGNVSNLKRLSMEPPAPAKKYLGNNGSTVSNYDSQDSSQSMTPSQLTNPANRKFSTRTNGGQILCDYNTISDDIKLPQKPASDKLWPLSTLSSAESWEEQGWDFLYMFDRWNDRAHILDNYICEHIDHILLQNNLDESCLSRACFPLLEEGYTAGFIAVESSGRLTGNSCLLIGASKSGLGAVLLDLSDPDLSFSLFPGMPVVVKGTNPTGKLFIVKEVYTRYVPERINAVKHLDEEDSDLHVLLACGPFTTTDSLEATPLLELLKQASFQRPHVMILFGPFVDDQHPKIKEYHESSYEDLFLDRLNSIARVCSTKNIQLVLVSSHQDVHHHPVFPTPPYDDSLAKDRNPVWYKNVKFVSDPCLLKIGSYSFGLTGTDILMHLGGEEISAKCCSDRMTRLCQLILRQKNFYPLQPPREDLPVDYQLWEKFCSLPEIPDIFVLPSNLRQFIKNVSGVVCVNPGRLTRGEAGGTFCRLIVSNSSRKNTENDPDENVLTDNHKDKGPETIPCHIEIVRI